MPNFKDIFKTLILESQETQGPALHQRNYALDLETNKTIVVYGPRRSGKSYFFYQVLNELVKHKVHRSCINYINFEDDRLLNLQSSDLQTIVDAYYELYPENINNKVYWLFDEIQTTKDWEKFIRRIGDKENSKIFITGSSAELFSHEIATSLRGRAISYPLYPLNFSEYLDFKGITHDEKISHSKKRFEIIKELAGYLEYGRFPELAEANDIGLRRKILHEYYQSLIYRDLLDRYSLRNTELLRDILKKLATDITKPFSVNAYYKSIKEKQIASKDTLYEYIQLISETRYFSFIPAFSYSLKEQRVNPRKIICLDNGLRNHITFRLAADTGRLAENLVGELLLETGLEIFYYQGKQEVDFVVKHPDNSLTAINVNYGEEIDPRENAGLLEFKGKYPQQCKELLIISKDLKATENGIKILPLWQWLLNYPGILPCE